MSVVFLASLLPAVTCRITFNLSPMAESFPFVASGAGLRASVGSLMSRYGLKNVFELTSLWIVWYFNDRGVKPCLNDFYAGCAALKRSGNRAKHYNCLSNLAERGYITRKYGGFTGAELFITPSGLRVLADYERRLASFRPDFSGIRGLADVDPA